MDRSLAIITWPTVLAGVLTTAGLYLLLLGGVTTRLRWCGGILLAVVLGILLAGTSAEWWPPSKMQSFLFATPFVLLACLSTVSASVMLLARDEIPAAAGSTAMMLANAGLCLLAGAPSVAVMLLLLHAGAIARGWMVFTRGRMKGQGEQTAENPQPHTATAPLPAPRSPFRALSTLYSRLSTPGTAPRTAYEPWLAALTGGILLAGLLAAVRVSTTVDPNDPRFGTAALPAAKRAADAPADPTPRAANRRENDWQLLSNFLLVGLALFTLGSVGCIVRRSLVSTMLSVGTMLQGGVLTLVGFSAFRATWSGQVFAMAALSMAAAYALLAFAVVIVPLRPHNPGEEVDCGGSHQNADV